MWCSEPRSTSCNRARCSHDTVRSGPPSEIGASANLSRGLYGPRMTAALRHRVGDGFNYHPLPLIRMTAVGRPPAAASRFL